MSSSDRPAAVPTGLSAPGARERTLRALLSVVEDLTVERDAEALLRTTLEHVVGALGISGGAAFLAGPQGRLFTQPAVEVGITQIDRATVVDLAQTTLASGELVFRETPDTGWVALVPLVSRGRRLGALVLHDELLESPPPDHALLVGLGKQIGTGLDNARLYAELRASSERVAILNRITAALASGRDLGLVVPAFAEELGRLERFDRLACAFVNESGDYFEIACHPEGSAWGLGSVIPVVGSGPGSVVLNSEVVLQGDLLHSHRFIEDMRLLEEGIRSYMLLPLNARGRAIGVLALGARRAGAFDEATASRLQPLADAVALAFENVRLFQRTRELSITDELTPLYNVRFFHQILDRELKLVDRYRSVLSLVFVDLDRFKPINDTYGHLRGSRVLREVGFLLRAAVRETDYPARYGGDEFVVILPQTDGTSARLLSEKLRALIEEHVFLQEEGINARLGISLGVATYPEDARNKESLIRVADERMYRDKAERKER